ncbi:hypothetical protein ACTWP5_25725 [Streptomyces sp. 4N509B]|uniref:hypothetical protein n=1 Tax=Streptomyces sp. 4N509B TaxID=3457413 RepID=UPI003FD59A57
MHTRMRLIAPAAAIAATLLLAGCSDDGDGGPPTGGLTGGNGAGELSDLELETTGGIGEGAEAEAEAGGGGGGGGGGAWYALWTSGDLEVYTTENAVLWGDQATGTTCTSPTGLQGSLDWEPVLLTCSDGSVANTTFTLTSDDTLSIEWDDRTEEFTKFESLEGMGLELADLEAEFNL